jgi:hypothetical protein
MVRKQDEPEISYESRGDIGEPKETLSERRDCGATAVSNNRVNEV